MSQMGLWESFILRNSTFRMIQCRILYLLQPEKMAVKFFNVLKYGPLRKRLIRNYCIKKYIRTVLEIGVTAKGT